MAEYEFSVRDERFSDDAEDERVGGKIFDTGYRLEREIFRPEAGKAYWLYHAKIDFFGTTPKCKFTTSKKDPIAYEQIAFIFQYLKLDSIPIYMEKSSFLDASGKKVETARYFVGFAGADELTGGLQITIRTKNESDKNFWRNCMERLDKKIELGIVQPIASIISPEAPIPPETPPAETPGKKNKS